MKSLYRAMRVQVEHWTAQLQVREVALTFSDTPEGVRIVDTRFDERSDYVLSGAASLVYKEVDAAPISVSPLERGLAKLSPKVVADLEGVLAELEECRLIWRDRGMVLGLAVPLEVASGHAERQWVQEWYAVSGA